MLEGFFHIIDIFGEIQNDLTQMGFSAIHRAPTKRINKKAR